MSNNFSEQEEMKTTFVENEVNKTAITDNESTAKSEELDDNVLEHQDDEDHHEADEQHSDNIFKHYEEDSPEELYKKAVKLIKMSLSQKLRNTSRLSSAIFSFTWTKSEERNYRHLSRTGAMRSIFLMSNLSDRNSKKFTANFGKS